MKKAKMDTMKSAAPKKAPAAAKSKKGGLPPAFLGKFGRSEAKAKAQGKK